MVSLGVIQKIKSPIASYRPKRHFISTLSEVEMFVIFIVIISEKSGSMTIYRGHVRALSLARLEFICDSDKVDLC